MFNFPDNTQSIAALGSVTSPSLQFFEDSDTGIDSFAPNTVSLVVGGAKAVTFSNDGQNNLVMNSNLGTGLTLQASGSNIFAATTSTGTWTDAVSTTLFYTGVANGNTLFSAIGTQFNRLLYAAARIQFSTKLTGVVVPVDYFEMRTGTGAGAANGALVLSITNKGNIKGAPQSNTPFLTLTGFSLTGSDASGIVDLAGTWNTSAVVTGIKLNITNTASGAGSNLLDLQVASTSQFKLGTTGKLTAYNAIATVSNGVPSELATIDSTGLTANVAAATLYAVPAAGEGLYRVSAYLVTTTAASVSSTMPNAQVLYTDKDSNTAVTLDVSPILGAAGLGQSGTLAANTVGTVFSGTVVIYVKASTTIQYQTTNYASTIAGMAYALRIKLESL